MPHRPSATAPAARAATERPHGCAVCGATDLYAGDGHADRCPGAARLEVNGLRWTLRSA